MFVFVLFKLILDLKEHSNHPIEFPWATYSLPLPNYSSLHLTVHLSQLTTQCGALLLTPG